MHRIRFEAKLKVKEASNVQQAIGVIDSGVGGLTVVKEIMRQLPKERIVYFGDTKRCPYGPRPADQVRMFTHQMIRYLLQHHIKVLVIGCNTATAVVLDELNLHTNLPVIGVIEPEFDRRLKRRKTGGSRLSGRRGRSTAALMKKG